MLTRKRLVRCNNDKNFNPPVLDTFHHFPQLPYELREIIWAFAIHPRLITWHHSQAPPLLHTCHESRSFWLKKHKIEHWRTNTFSHETLFIDYSSDILYFEGVMPGWKQWTEIPTKIATPTGHPLFWPSWIGKDDVGGGKWLGEVQRLAISSEVMLREFNFTPPPPPPPSFWVPHFPHAEMANPWARLNELCPELRELIVIFGGGLSKDSVVEDWVEVGRRRVPVEPWNWRWDLPNFRATTFVAKSLGRVKMVDVMLVKARKSVKATVRVGTAARK
jgi:hypothetical protein